MNKKAVYTIIAIVLLVGVYGFDFFQNLIDSKKKQEHGAEVKIETNTFLLPSSTTGQVVHHKGFSLSYHEAFEQAEWVAYELKKSQLSETQFKRPFFEIDYAVKTKSADWRNYKNSNYDRGHLCPAGDRAFDKEVYNETFLTSNITPQEHDFNSGIWNDLEAQVRQWASRYNGVYVVTGGVLKKGLKTIGSENVAVPDQFYKIVFDGNAKQPKMIGFLIPHYHSSNTLIDYTVPVDSIEKITGIDFFPNLEDALENRLESQNNYKLWKFRK